MCCWRLTHHLLSPMNIQNPCWNLVSYYHVHILSHSCSFWCREVNFWLFFVKCCCFLNSVHLCYFDFLSKINFQYSKHSSEWVVLSDSISSEWNDSQMFMVCICTRGLVAVKLTMSSTQSILPNVAFSFFIHWK